MKNLTIYTENEIHKILAEFEFSQEVDITGNHVYKKNYTQQDWINGTHELASRYYTSDLNTLIPIWVKLETFGIVLRFDKGTYSQSHGYFLIDKLGDEYGRKFPEGETLQFRLALATALAIKEIKGDLHVC